MGTFGWISALKTKKFWVNLVHRSLAEFYGTCGFVFVSVLSTSSHTGTDGPSPSSVVTVALSHGLGLMGMVAAFGHVSGGHFNPAVTLGAFISGRINWLTALCYVLVQIAGGICGCLIVLVSLDLFHAHGFALYKIAQYCIIRVVYVYTHI